MRKYKIFMMSARNIISYAEKNSDGIYKFNLQARETEKCKVPTASHEQESNALFYQIMCHLHGDNFEFPENINLPMIKASVIYLLLLLHLSISLVMTILINSKQTLQTQLTTTLKTPLP